ncbi:hypothetical protein DERF_008972 [Dermatophagoides farinae]|uniref:Uncharacterized protein n=1 Tax=Dermatophagoides farinae TaxID=6954 RepID=A0A922HVH1_DERFA|nr:hypothetical protein DERF_008972 [Dermatophagoides farinae]
MPLNSSSSSEVEVASKETHSVKEFEFEFFELIIVIIHVAQNGAFTILQKATAVDDSMLSVFMR